MTVAVEVMPPVKMLFSIDTFAKIEEETLTGGG